MPDPRLPDKIRDKIAPEPNTGCWLWTAGCVGGYGQAYFEGQPISAHRLVYVLLVGEIERRRHIDHLCEVKSCVNPDHMEVVSCRENQRRYSWNRWKEVAQMAAHRGKRAVDGPKHLIRAEISRSMLAAIDFQRGSDRATKIRELLEEGLAARFAEGRNRRIEGREAEG